MKNTPFAQMDLKLVAIWAKIAPLYPDSVNLKVGSSPRSRLMSSRRELANAICALSMDAVQKAKSGHPGAPMGMADIAEVLWNDFMKHNPKNPDWVNRDRFILSNGHGSMLLYSLLHLSGYELRSEEHTSELQSRP